jgi:putative hydrolase
MDPVTPADVSETLKRIAYRLELDPDRHHQARAFSRAARIVKDLPATELVARASKGTLTDLPGVGKVIAGVIADVIQGKDPGYFEQLPPVAAREKHLPEAGAAILRQLKGDCHVHSDWSDGGASIEEMALAAIELGHQYMVLSDHSPTLKIARGLDADRLRAQLEVVRKLNDKLHPFRISPASRSTSSRTAASIKSRLSLPSSISSSPACTACYASPRPSSHRAC